LRFRPVIYFFVSVFFLISGFLATKFLGSDQSEHARVQEITRNLKTELAKSDHDLAVAQGSPANVQDNSFSYPLFIFQRDKLVYWSDNSFVPSFQVANDTFKIKLFVSGSSMFILNRAVRERQIYLSLIKLYREFPITNNYLQPEVNEEIFSFSDFRIEDASSPGGHKVCVDGTCYFSIMFAEGNPSMFSAFPFLLFVLSVVFIVLFAYSIIPLVSKKYAELGFLVLLASFILIRMSFSASGFPANYFDSPLFDAQVFAVSTVNPSLGDLLLNLLAVLAISFYVFNNYYKFNVVAFEYREVAKWFITIFSSLVILFGGLFPIVVIQTLYNNSTIVIDISQSLQFDLLRVVAIVCILIAGICSFLFMHAFTRILFSLGKFRLFASLIIASIIFAVINELTNQHYVPTLVCTMLYVIVIYFLKLHKSLRTLSFSTFAYLFVAIFFLSVNGAYTIQKYTQKEKIENQFKFASNFLIDRDIFAEYLLDEASIKIARDAFIQSRISNPFLGKEPVRQKIRQIFLPSYFNKYDVNILIFNSLGDPVSGGVIPLSSYLQQYDNDAYKTKYDRVRFIDNPVLDVTQMYLVIVPINRGGITSAHIVIELSLKKIIPENVYPELLVDHSFQQFYRTQDLSYAVFANKNILYTSGEFNYERFFDPSVLGRPELYTTGLSLNNFDHIAVEDQSTRLAIVSAVRPGFTHKLSNFSFLFTLGLLVILFMIFIQGIAQYFRGTRLFFSARIQLYLNLAFFIPLLIVSISTLSLTSRSSQQQLNDEYLNKSRIFSQQMMSFVEDDEVEAHENHQSIENRLTDLAKLSNLDANLYHPDGVLIASSQPLIFENGLISTYLKAGAFQRVKDGETFFIESEKVGTLEYFVAYAVLKSAQSRELIGILGIPFFQSGYLLEKIQSVILINILNVFALIFILLLVLSYIVADRLTFPLRFITQSLRKTSLTKNNTPLTWPAQDEIGYMVKEYNSMLYKLGESKSELEQTQREKAWREIAQQVAHEIKNPLTPMKLTLQQLERNVQAGNNSSEKTQKAITTLLGQVDTLNQIASSFSGFAKMPEPVIQRIDVIAILRRAIDLHSPTGEIQLRSSVREAWVMADEQILTRTFSNLILNAIQASIPGRNAVVQISVDNLSGFCRIHVRDNGKGIEPEIADRVFLPHFSTKKAGSGLGLAIAKQGIDQMNGRIWFETQPGVGTSFYLELPLSQ
jgi:two-component system, NtrC family, nitrogen regulation sensor histidine kinase NtrY